MPIDLFSAAEKEDKTTTGLLFDRDVDKENGTALMGAESNKSEARINLLRYATEDHPPHEMETAHTAKNKSWSDVMKYFICSIEFFTGEADELLGKEEEMIGVSESTREQESQWAQEILGDYIENLHQIQADEVKYHIETMISYLCRLPDDERDTRRKCKFAVDDLLRGNKKDPFSGFRARELLLGSWLYLNSPEKPATSAEVKVFIDALVAYIAIPDDLLDGEDACIKRSNDGIFKSDPEIQNSSGIDSSSSVRMEKIARSINTIARARVVCEEPSLAFQNPRVDAFLGNRQTANSRRAVTVMGMFQTRDVGDRVENGIQHAFSL